MKVILVDGIPYLYRPESEEEEKEMLMSLARAIREQQLKIPKSHTQLIDKLMKLADKNVEEALKVLQSDSTLQALCSSMYAGEHPTYDPNKVREVDAENELQPNVLVYIREQIKSHKVKPLKHLGKSGN